MNIDLTMKLYFYTARNDQIDSLGRTYRIIQSFFVYVCAVYLCEYVCMHVCTYVRRALYTPIKNCTLENVISFYALNRYCFITIKLFRVIKFIFYFHYSQ